MSAKTPGGRLSSFLRIHVIFAKDLKSFSRDRLWMILTPLTIVAFVLIFWLIPGASTEKITIGVCNVEISGFPAGSSLPAMGGESAVFVRFDEPSKMIEAIKNREKVPSPGGGKTTINIGIDFGRKFAEKVASGKGARVKIYTTHDAPREIETAVKSFAHEISYALAGRKLPVEIDNLEKIMLESGMDGATKSMRYRLLPLLAFTVLLVEAFALSSLISSEVRSRTISAIAVTPATTAEIIASKALTGTILAMGEVIVFLAATRSFTSGNVLSLLMTVFSGAMLATAVGVLSGSAGRDFMGTLFISMAFLIPMVIPGFAALFPGTASIWIKILPSYGIIQAIMGVTSRGKSLTEISPYLGMSLGWAIALLAVGFASLRKKVAFL